MEFRLLGLLEVGERGRIVPLARGRERALLALLLLHANEPVSTDRLVEELWPVKQPDHAGKTLQVYVSRLRKTIGAARLKTTPAGYVIEVEAGELDISRFEQLTAAGRAALEAGDFKHAVRLLREALALWRGPALADFRFDSFAQPETRRLEELQAAARADLIDARMSHGDANGVKADLEQLINENPLWERPRSQLMLALYRDGRQADALELYRSTRRLLADELGVEPSPALQALERAILNHDSALRSPALARRVVARRAGRWLLLGGALIAAAAVAAVITFVRSGGEAPSIAPGANSVAAIDPDTNRVTAAIPVGGSPAAVATGGDAIWVANADNSVSRIEPATSDVRQTIQVGGGPAGIAAGGDAVWVANGLDGTVSRIDPTANRVVQTIAVGNGPNGVTHGEGAVWVTNSADGTVSQIDPDTGKVTRTLPAVIGASGIAVAFGRVWITSPPSGSVAVLDPQSGRVLKRIGVGVDPDAVAAGVGAVWVVNRADATVSRIDPGSAAVTDTVDVGRSPSAIAAGSAGVWVANRADRSLSRIDPSRGKTVRTVELGNPPLGIGFARKWIYVAVGSTGHEHQGGRLRVLDINPVDSIDFALARPLLWPVLIMTNDGLVGFRRVGGVQGAQLVPDLAVALPTPTDAGRTYTFQMRPGIRYSNGKLVQPDDFRRAIERIFEVGGFEYAYYYTGIVGAQRCAKGRLCNLSRGVVADRATRTVTFHLTGADPDFLAKLALPPTFAAPAGTPQRGRYRVPATGPYRIAEYRPEAKTLRLVRNPGFREWSSDAQPRGYPDSISWSWRFTADPIAQVRAVERGVADVALGGTAPLSKPQLDLLAVRHPNQLHVSTQLGTTFFFLNTRVPPFDDVRARRAVNYAVDREAYARLLGPAFGPTCQVLPPNFPGYRQACPYVPDIDKARRLVRDSHTLGARVTVWVPAPLAAQGRYIVSVLNTMGYRARLKPVNRDVYYQTVSNSTVRAQIGYYSWFAAYPSAVDFIPPQLSCAAFVPASGQNGNLAEFCDRAVDAQIARAVSVQRQDPAAATELWRQIEQSLLARAPVVPTYNQRQVDFVSARLGNYQFNPQWGLLLDQAWVK